MHDRCLLDQMLKRPFIFNLGHGILQATPPAHVEHLVALVKGAGAPRSAGHKSAPAKIGG
jgi:uroporphyrinogen-III decarboxylase